MLHVLGIAIVPSKSGKVAKRGISPYMLSILLWVVKLYKRFLGLLVDSCTLVASFVTVEAFFMNQIRIDNVMTDLSS